MFGIVSWLREVLKIKQELTVEIVVFRDEVRGGYIVGYGHREGQVRNIGVGETVVDAFMDLSEVINGVSRTPWAEVQKELSRGVDVPVDVAVYFIPSESEYVVVISSGGEVVEGCGSSMSRAFADVGVSDKEGS